MGGYIHFLYFALSLIIFFEVKRSGGQKETF